MNSISVGEVFICIFVILIFLYFANRQKPTRVFLVLWTTQDDVLGKIFENRDEWHFELNHDLKLVPGTVINLVDPVTDKCLELIINGQIYDYDDNVLRLEFKINNNEGMTPEEFFAYISEYWFEGTTAYR